MTRTLEICNSFNAHAREYEQAAVVQAEIGERLFERLQYLKINPRYVLDLGCGTGIFTQKLKRQYPNAVVVGFDIAHLMLLEAKHKQGFLQKWPLVSGDMAHMPFADGLFDLVFSNQVIHWADSLPNMMRELNRVMHVGGCFMFSTLGPDTFCELKQPSAGSTQVRRANEFVDMHDVGDYLLAECFLDPVVDMEVLTAHFTSPAHLFRALKQQGVKNIHSLRNKGLTGKASWSVFEQSVLSCQTSTGKIPLTYEVVYGHAWKGEKRRVSDGMETYIPVSSLFNRS